MANMPINQFWARYNATVGFQKHQRRGQYLFNMLDDTRPDLSKVVRGNVQLDPFYDDSKIAVLTSWLKENWR